MERKWKSGMLMFMLRLMDWSCDPKFASERPVRLD